MLDLLTYYPRRYVDRTNEAAHPRPGGRRGGDGPGDRRPGRRPAAPGAARPARWSPPRSATAPATCGSRSSTRRGGSASSARARRWCCSARSSMFRGQRQMTNPVVDLIGDQTGRIVPIYPQSEKAGLSTWEIGGWVAEALRRSQPGGLADPVPGVGARPLRPRRPGRGLRRHPRPRVDGAQGGGPPAPGVRRAAAGPAGAGRSASATSSAPPGASRHGDRRPARSPVPRPAAVHADRRPGRRPSREIATDLAGPHPMHRLLQGDVGAGKTVVAVCALLVAVQGGHQGAFMAPTEVLAEQHAAGIRACSTASTVPDAGTSLFGARPLRVELLTNRMGAADRRRILAGLAVGRGRHRHRHPRADPGGRRLPLARGGRSSTSSTASASSSGPRCGTRPAGARCPTCW